MGSIAAQLFSGLSRDVGSGSSPALAGPLEDIQRLVPKPLLRCLGWVLFRVMVQLEGEPSPQSDVLSGLEQVFIKDLIAPFIFPSILTSFPVPAWCHVSSRRDSWHSGQRVQSWFHQTRESCFSWFESFLGAFWQTPSGLSCAFY